MRSHSHRRRGRALVASGSALVLAATGLVAASPAVAGTELISNGSFDSGASGWNIYGGSGQTTDGGVLCYDVPGGGDPSAPWSAAVAVQNLTLQADTEYTLTFDASATPATAPKLVVQSASLGYYSPVSDNPALTESLTQKTYIFTPNQTASDFELAFQLGHTNAYTFCLDNVSLADDVDPEQVVNGDFSDGLNSWDQNNLTGAAVTDGQFCATVPGGTPNPWSSGLSQNTVNLADGQNYKVSFSASASQDVVIRVLIGQASSPFATYKEWAVPVGTTAEVFSDVFTAQDTDPAAQIAFQVGGKSATDWTFCLDDVSFAPTSEQPSYVPDTGSDIRVNQFGYLPKGPKKGTLVTDATEPVPFELHNSAGAVVFSGLSQPAGFEESSDLNVHVLDFSKYRRTGSGFTIVVGDQTSYPFDIAVDLYEKLRVDAASYYYPARSGIAIDGSIVGDEEYTRPAGHVSSPADGDVNQGDYDVPCQSLASQAGVYDASQQWTCPEGYTLDVIGGWYDAGDHGKYVVNGGISVAQLMQAYERSQTVGRADKRALRDGTLRIVEQGNGVPDILDEARWELEWMLRMQVPAGTTMTIGGNPVDMSGMVHHKIHDLGWTGLPLMPHLDPQVRQLHRPSTAATLNFAAVAAQGARLFAKYDKAFAAELLESAKAAYAAAEANPAIYAPGSDGANGGGPYNDTDVSDEFFWAAAELYVTTSGKGPHFGGPGSKGHFGGPGHKGPHFGGKGYRDDVVDSSVYGEEIEANGINNSIIGFDWAGTAPLGWITLAHNAKDPHIRKTAEKRIVAVANEIVGVQDAQPWGHMYDPTNGVYQWGSNNLVANNMVLVGTAFDLTNKAVYRDAVLESFDYLLGRNALNRSYITGYGELDSRNQHSRWWANQLNPALPNPPDGALAGGPNSQTGTWDPTWAGTDPLLEGGSCTTRPQWCYIDDINSWATNEITVNWNSVLTWVANFAADQDKG